MFGRPLTEAQRPKVSQIEFKKNTQKEKPKPTED